MLVASAFSVIHSLCVISLDWPRVSKVHLTNPGSVHNSLISSPTLTINSDVAGWMDGRDRSPGLTDGWEEPAKKSQNRVEYDLFPWRNKAFLPILISIFCVLYNKNRTELPGYL